MKLFRDTKEHTKYWTGREMDWKKDYLDTWAHPHRYYISHILSGLKWGSLLEIGCGSGPNLVNLVKHFPGKQVGGIDIVPEAIELAQKTFKGAFLKVGSAEDLMMSDKSTDIILTDMCLIYVNKPDKAMREIRRVARNYVMFCELHTESWWMRLRLKWGSGYTAHNYVKLLQKYGFYDITKIKIPEEMWPGGNPQKDYGYIIIAKTPKR